MKHLKHIFLFGIVFMITACGPTLHRVNHTPAIESTSVLPKGAVGVFVFREDRPFDSSAVNIYIDGRYFASLQKNSYRYVDLCPGRHYVSAAIHHSDPGYYSKLKTDQPFELTKNSVIYLKVSGSQNGEITFVSVPEQEVDRVLGHLQLQNHTISRVVSGYKCINLD